MAKKDEEENNERLHLAKRERQKERERESAGVTERKCYHTVLPRPPHPGLIHIGWVCLISSTHCIHMDRKWRQRVAQEVAKRTPPVRLPAPDLLLLCCIKMRQLDD